jgi:hypothetical protein
LKLEVAIDNASQKIAKLVQIWAPVGETGDLKAGIQAVDSGDAILGDSVDLLSSITLIL